jgi:hypothetical protein
LLNEPNPPLHQPFVVLDAPHADESIEPMLWQQIDDSPTAFEPPISELMLQALSGNSNFMSIQQYWMQFICTKISYMTRYLSSSPPMSWSMLIKAGRRR